MYIMFYIYNLFTNPQPALTMVFINMKTYMHRQKFMYKQKNL